MRPETRVMGKIDRLMEKLETYQQRSVAYYVHRTYGGALTGAERTRRWRDGNVTEPSDEIVTRYGDGNVTQQVTKTSQLTKEVASEVLTASSENGSKKQRVLEATEVLQFLNRKAERTFRPVPATLKPIIARLTEGASVEDCKVVIGRKVAEWSGKDQALYLRPKTLFAAENFQNYLGQQRPQ